MPRFQHLQNVDKKTKTEILWILTNKCIGSNGFVIDIIKLLYDLLYKSYLLPLKLNIKKELVNLENINIVKFKYHYKLFHINNKQIDFRYSQKYGYVILLNEYVQKNSINIFDINNNNSFNYNIDIDKNNIKFNNILINKYNMFNKNKLIEMVISDKIKIYEKIIDNNDKTIILKQDNLINKKEILTKLDN